MLLCNLIILLIGNKNISTSLWESTLLYPYYQVIFVSSEAFLNHFWLCHQWQKHIRVATKNILKWVCLILHYNYTLFIIFSSLKKPVFLIVNLSLTNQWWNVPFWEVTRIGLQPLISYNFVKTSLTLYFVMWFLCFAGYPKKFYLKTNIFAVSMLFSCGIWQCLCKC